MNSAGMNTTSICNASTSETARNPFQPFCLRSSEAPATSFEDWSFMNGIIMSRRKNENSPTTARTMTATVTGLRFLVCAFFRPESSLEFSMSGSLTGCTCTR